MLLNSPDGTAYTFPRWSPDGRSLVFTIEKYDVKAGQGIDYSNTPTGMAISTWKIGAEPSTIRPLTDFSMFSSYADWQPGGDLIVFDTYTPSVMHGEGVINVWTVHSDGTRPTDLTGATWDGSGWAEPTWSPDGRQIIMTVVQRGLGNKSLALMNADGTGQHPVILAKDGEYHARQARLRPGG